MTAVVRPGVNISELCKQADRLLKAGEFQRATSLYMSAFRTHGASTAAHMRSLKSDLSGVVATLEGWLDGRNENQCPEGLSKGLVAVFLSTLCPNNLSATIFKMESLLQSGGHGCEEIFARCTALLEGKWNPGPQGTTSLLLDLVRALACLLSENHGPKGLKLYLETYQRDKSETVTLVKSRHAQHIPKIVSAFTDHVLHTHPALMLHNKCAVSKEGRNKADEEASLIIEFLLALSPGNREVQELQAANWFLTGRFEDSVEAYSTLLEHFQKTTLEPFQDSSERRAVLLTGRAAASLSAGGRTAEACRDLGEAFEHHPATARICFQKLFADLGTGTAARDHVRQQAERGLSSYRERVLVRPDLRSTEGVELLDPVIIQLRTLCHLEPDGGGRELRVRLAECLLLRGEHREALSICSQLAAGQGQQSYQNTVQVLRGYARFLSDDHKGALEDFQAVIEHSAPHPCSCVRALCGRGLLRMMGGLNYLTALDYVTASRLQPQETALTVRCLVPWNYRGLLFTVLLEQGRVMLEGTEESMPSSSGDSKQSQQGDQLQALPKRDDHRSGYDVCLSHRTLTNPVNQNPSCSPDMIPNNCQQSSVFASLLTQLECTV